MKWTLSLLLALVGSTVYAEDMRDTAQTLLQQDQNYEIQQQDDQFSDNEVGQALEKTESTLEQIGREIASEGEIEVVE